MSSCGALKRRPVASPLRAKRPSAARRALQVYEALLEAVQGSDAAHGRALAANRLAQVYRELHGLALELLRSVARRSHGHGHGHQVLSFKGTASDRRRKLSQRLALARRPKLGARREALAAALAALCAWAEPRA